MAHPPKFGHVRIELSQVDSTNAFAARLLAADSPPVSGTVVVARTQTAGRGQRGKSWVASPGQNLTFSLVLMPTFLAAGSAFSLSKVVALGLHDFLTGYAPAATVAIKWPNDLLFDGQKIAGILIETQIQGDRLRAAIIGLGLNVNQIEFSGAWDREPTSLKRETGTHFELSSVLDRVLVALQSRYDQLRRGEAHQLDRSYLERLYRYQESSGFRTRDRSFTGQIIGVDIHGRLAVAEGGRVHYFGVGEVAMRE